MSIMSYVSTRPRALGEDAIYSSLAASVREKTGSELVFIGELNTGQIVRDSFFVVGVTPTVQGVLSAKKNLDVMRQYGVEAERIFMVLLFDRWPGAVATSIIEEELRCPLFKLPFELGLLLTAENSGQNIREMAPRSATARAIEKCTAAMIAGATRPLKADAPTASRAGADEQRIEKHLRERLWTQVGAHAETNEALLNRLENVLAHELMDIGALTPDSKQRIFQNVVDYVVGYGPLEKIRRERDVNEIMVNGKDAIFVEESGKIMPVADVFVSDAHLLSVIDRMVAQAGRRVDIASPLCDARLPDGSRINVVLPPVSLCGPLLTLRRFKPNVRSFDDLISLGALTSTQADFLTRAVRDHENIVIAGNSGSGKTTLLNVLSQCISAEERVITMEDAAELDLQNAQVVRLETRPKNTEGQGDISMKDLVVNALRMRPDRLIVGECRGAEVVPLLQAMNTGHDGSMSTVHANSAEDAVKRLEAMTLLGAPQWPVAVVREQIASAIDLIVYLKREGRARKLVDIARIAYQDGILQLAPVSAIR